MDIVSQSKATEMGSVIQNRSRVALWAVSFSVTVWSLSNVGIKSVSTTGLVASFYRLWMAIPLLWILAFMVPAVRNRLDGNWLRACLAGGVLFGFHQLGFFVSIKLTSVANVTIIGALQPVLVYLVAFRLFGEKGNWRHLCWALFALVGIIVVIIGSSGMPAHNLWGDALAFLNLLVFTGYFLVSKRIRERVGATEYMVGVTTVAGIIVGVAVLTTGQDLGSPTLVDLSILLIIALVPGTLGHLLLNWAHNYSSAFVVSIMLLAIPVLSSAAAALFLGENLSLLQILGALIVLFSIGMVIRATHMDS